MLRLPRRERTGASSSSDELSSSTTSRRATSSYSVPQEKKGTRVLTRRQGAGLLRPDAPSALFARVGHAWLGVPLLRLLTPLAPWVVGDVNRVLGLLLQYQTISTRQRTNIGPQRTLTGTFLFFTRIEADASGSAAAISISTSADAPAAASSGSLVEDLRLAASMAARSRIRLSHTPYLFSASLASPSKSKVIFSSPALA